MRWVGYLLLGVVVVAGVSWAFGAIPGIGTDDGGDMQTHVVARGVLEVKVVEQGSLESTSNVEVKCRVEGSSSAGNGRGTGTQIISIFPEGEYVEKGAKLVELDQAGLKQSEIEQKIAVETAHQELIKAEKDFEAASIAVDEYQYGTFISDLKTLESEITVAKENWRRARDFAAHTEQMFQRGFSTKTQLEADQFAAESTAIALEALETKKRALVEYTKAKTLAELRGVRDANEAAVKSLKAKYELEQNNLKDIQDQLTKCVITAPERGMVTYANDDWWRQERQVQEGAVVRFGQTLIRLPDLSKMRVKANVHESMIQKVKRGQTVNIAVDALPDLKLTGTVETINNQPEHTRWMSGDVKEYAVLVDIENEGEDLKPGMTAEVEILVERLESVLTVPVQAVVNKDKERFCYVKTDAGVEERPVVLGASDDIMIEIKDGLNEGDAVVLNPRALLPEARAKGPLQQQKPEPTAAREPLASR